LAKQQELLAAARDGGMRLIGPNCLGLVNFHTGLTLTATPALNTKVLLPGNLMVLSQSGSIMGALVSRGFARGIGFSKAISVGNEADLTVGDIGEAFVDDPDTSAFLVFLETLRDADALARFARMAFERSKPIVAYKLGRSAVGREMAVSHTGALVGSDRAVDAFSSTRHHSCGPSRDVVRLARAADRQAPADERQAAVGVVATMAAAALVVDRLGVLGVETRAPQPSRCASLPAHGLRSTPARDRSHDGGTRSTRDEGRAGYAARFAEFDLILAVVGNSAEFNFGGGAIADAGGGKPVVAFLGPNADIGLRMLADATCRVPHAGIRMTPSTRI
jgi:acyl-CoA synthetase (NDP forming)